MKRKKRKKKATREEAGTLRFFEEIFKLSKTKGTTSGSEDNVFPAEHRWRQKHIYFFFLEWQSMKKTMEELNHSSSCSLSKLARHQHHQASNYHCRAISSTGLSEALFETIPHVWLLKLRSFFFFHLGCCSPPLPSKVERFMIWWTNHSLVRVETNGFSRKSAPGLRPPPTYFRYLLSFLVTVYVHVLYKHAGYPKKMWDFFNCFGGGGGELRTKLFHFYFFIF